MSVAVEEMLHMSLSSNVLYALGVAPQLYGKAPQPYPTPLPYHRPKGPPGPDGSTAELIPLGGFGFEQLWHFLQIEYPEAWDALPEDRELADDRPILFLHTLPAEHQVRDRRGFPARAPVASAIQPYNYSPNNIDTVYPKGKFRSLEAGAAGADARLGEAGQTSERRRGRRVHRRRGQPCRPDRPHRRQVASRTPPSAIDTICDQGEGYPVPAAMSTDDDPSKDEQSHYVKFLESAGPVRRICRLQGEAAEEAARRPRRSRRPFTAAQLVEAGVLVDFPDNPTNEGYPARAVSRSPTFCSGLFQYMLIMIETIYRVPPEGQKLFFNEGLHRSMIWVLDKYTQTIRQPSRSAHGQVHGADLRECQTSAAARNLVRRPDRARQPGDRRGQADHRERSQQPLGSPI